ncbi:MAG: hypothetical protein ACLQGV_11320 [Bryobacteraceae bacterium]
MQFFASHVLQWELVPTPFRRRTPVLATATYLVLLTAIVLQATVWPDGDSVRDTLVVIVATLPFSLLALVFGGDRTQAFWFWGVCGLVNGVSVYVITCAFAAAAARPGWKMVRSALALCASVALLLWVVCLVLVPEVRIALSRTLFPGVCLVEELKQVPNLSGMRFEVVYENCDTLVKTEDVAVYVSRASAPGESLFAKWSNRRALVFGYDPGYPADPPSISAPSKDRILISIPVVSSIRLRRQKWKNVSIEYEVGRVIYDDIHASWGQRR